MRRRSVLRGTAALVGAAGLARSVRAHEGSGGAGTVAGEASDGYEPLGVVDVPGAREAVVGERGTVYVATGDGYACVDVRDPTAPAVLARRTGLQAAREDGPLVNVQDVKLDGDTLVVAGPAHPRRDALSGVVVVDVSDPTDPVERGFFETDSPVHNCDVADGRAYLTGNDGGRNPLVVVDVSDPTAPVELGRWSLLDAADGWGRVDANRRTLHDVTVHDGVAVCAAWDAGTWLVDVTDPTTPTVRGTVEAPAPDDLTTGPRPAVTPPGNHHYATLSEAGDLLAVGKETFGVRVDEDGDGRADRLTGGPSGVDLWDVSDLTAPERLSTVAPPESDDPTFQGRWTTAHNLDVRGDTLYTSWYQGGVKRHDLSDPVDPREESWWRSPDEASFWTARASAPGEFFVASSRGVGDVPGRLYTFPDRPGDQAAPPALTGETTRTPTASSTSRGESSPDGGTDPTTGEAPVSGSTVSAPGFGTGAGLTAVGLGAWWLWRWGDD